MPSAKEKPSDCVLCCQVLEHVFALDAFLADIGKLSTPESILYIEVPDAAGYADFFHAPFYYFDREHINHFTLGSLDNLVYQRLAYRPIYGERGSAYPVAGKKTPVLWAVYQPSAQCAKCSPLTKRAVVQSKLMSVCRPHVIATRKWKRARHPSSRFALGVRRSPSTPVGERLFYRN